MAEEAMYTASRFPDGLLLCRAAGFTATHSFSMSYLWALRAGLPWAAPPKCRQSQCICTHVCPGLLPRIFLPLQLFGPVHLYQWRSLCYRHWNTSLSSLLTVALQSECLWSWLYWWQSSTCDLSSEAAETHTVYGGWLRQEKKALPHFQ